MFAQDNSSELEALQKEAEEAIASARTYASEVIQKAKKATEKEIQEAVDETKQAMPFLHSDQDAFQCLFLPLLSTEKSPG